MNVTKTILMILCFLSLSFGSSELFAQAGSPEKPPRPMSVSSLQSLSFGTFTSGIGGTVTIDAWGVRTVSGVIALGSITYCPAVFLIDGEPGTLVRWIGSDATLTNGTGGIMTLHIDNSQNAYVAALSSSGDIRISIGGTLSVGALTPPGNYTGTFSITFIQE
jgi:hypothetical protein